jgi:hypothetical protein
MPSLALPLWLALRRVTKHGIAPSHIDPIRLGIIFTIGYSLQIACLALLRMDPHLRVRHEGIDYVVYRGSGLALQFVPLLGVLALIKGVSLRGYKGGELVLCREGFDDMEEVCR